MKKIFFAIISIIVLMAFAVNQDTSKVFKKLYVLEGTWIMKTKKGTIIGECWVKVNDQYLQNKGFYLKGKDTVVTERVALRRTNNEINYTSTVEDQNNKQPITFKLTSSENDLFVFENPEHDFPKRIMYQFVTADSIHAWIDNGKDAARERQDFYYRKTK